jgi:glucose/arabinose dehydrogenase
LPLALAVGLACSSAAPNKITGTGGDGGSGEGTGGASDTGGKPGTGGATGGSPGTGGESTGGAGGTGTGGSSDTGGSGGSGGGGAGGNPGEDAGAGGAGGMVMASAPCSTMGSVMPPALKKVSAADKLIPGAGQAVGVPGEPGIVYVLGHNSGNITVVQDGKVQPNPLVSIKVGQAAGNEQGLLSMALHPDFANNHLFYVFYSATDGASTVDEFERMTPTTAMFKQNIHSQPHKGPHHNGGTIYFNPMDKGKPWLYNSIGNDEDMEMASASAAPNGDQGRVLRMDVSTKMGVPAMGHTGFTFLYGFRNPYRMSIDRLTGDMYIGDVGNGPNGATFFNPQGMEGKYFGYGASGTELKFAMSITGEEDDKAFIGGVVYRGNKIPGLCGRYFYAVWPSGVIKSLIRSGGQWMKNTQSDLGGVGDISSFGEDGDGEILMSSNRGQLWRIVAGP